MDVSKKERERERGRRESPSPSLFQFFTIANSTHTHTHTHFVLARARAGARKVPPSLSHFNVALEREKEPLSLLPSHFYSFNTDFSPLSNMHTISLSPILSGDATMVEGT